MRCARFAPRILRPLVLAGVLGLAAHPAAADKRADAGQAFAEGQDADERGAYEDAVEAYLRAYSLAPHWNAAYNIALDYEHLDQFREAYRWFEVFVQTTDDSADRERVKERMQRLLARKSPLSVNTSPAGAEVRVDGDAVGTTPYNGKVSPGHHVVAVRRIERRAERPVDAAYGEPIRLDLDLGTAPGPGSDLATTVPVARKPGAVAPPGLVDPTSLAPAPGDPRGGLRIAGGPKNAVVFIDQQPVGLVGAWSGELVVAVGAHQVDVKRAGLAPFSTSIYVKANDEVTVDVPDLEDALDASGKGFRRLFGVAAGVGVDPALHDGTDSEFDEMVMVELGVRGPRGDIVSRVGVYHGELAIDAAYRYSYGANRLKAIFGLGFSYARGGPGVELIAGARYDLTRHGDTRFALVAESGIRTTAVTPDKDDDGTEETPETRAIIPLMLSIEVAR